MTENVERVPERVRVYDFTTDWFSANERDWKKLREDKPERYLEIGSFEGRSACTLIENYASLKEVICIDPWETDPQLPDINMAEVEARFDKNIAAAQKVRTSRGSVPVDVVKQKKTSFEALLYYVQQGRTEGFDLVYIDGSHMPEVCLMDMMLGFKLLRIGGVMVVDDYLWCQDKNGDDLLWTPRLAIDTFSLVMRRYASDIPRMSLYQRYFRKMRSTP